MSVKMFKNGKWLVQLQRNGQRYSKRGKGGEEVAKKAEASLISELDRDLRKREAAEVLGLDPEVAEKQSASRTPQTLGEYLMTRWASHARLVQNKTTLRTTATHVKYLAYFLGDRRLDKLSVANVNQMVESLHRDGPISFTLRQDGKPRQRRTTTFTPTAINRILGTLKACLNLAASEGTIAKAPKIKMLPQDNSKPIVPPTDTELQAIVEASRQFSEVAPHFPEVINLACETGLRAGELFHLTWGSVDFSMGDTGGLRVEEQHRARNVGGKSWKPKHLKFRIVPLTPLARQTLETLRDQVPHAPTDLVIPSRGGSPYVRLEAAPDRAGKGYWHDVLDVCDLRGKVRFHDLRHLFSVRCLQRGIPIAVVSAWLGHSDVNLTVKRYGRWSSEAREQWEWIKKLDKPVDAVAKGPWLSVVEGRGGR